VGIEFRILGPLDVRLDGAQARVGGARQRALLAMLLLSANRVVSRDRLIEELFADAPVETRDHTLRVQVSRLRQALSGEGGDTPRIVARAPGYLLRVEPGELDLHEFEELLAVGHRGLEAGEFELASGKLRQAESLWRGRPMADLEFEPFARLEVERLEELRTLAAEERLDAELALGRHGILVAELERRVAEHPLRERLRGQLMLALYRCGRQADALEVYRAGRALLSEELALEPTPALRQLERSILRQEPELDLAKPARSALAIEVAASPAGADLESASAESPTAPVSRRTRPWSLAAVALGLAAVVVGAVALAERGARTPSIQGNAVVVIEPSADALSAVIQAGGPPGGIATGAGAVWETDTADDLLLEINPATHAVERIPVGHEPTGVAVGGGEVWVVNQLDRTVSEINPSALRQVGSFPVGTGASQIVFGDGSVWVANVLDDTVSRIDPASGTVTTIPLAGQPSGIAVAGDGVWVTSASTGQLLLIDPTSGQVTQQQEIGGDPAGVAVGAGSVWIANTSDGTVTRFDPDTGAVSEIDVGQAPLGIAYGDGAAWVADSLGGTIARIDPRSDAARLVHLGGAPTAVAVDRNGVWSTVLPGPAAHRGGTLTVVEEGEGNVSLGNSVDPAQWGGGLSQFQMLSLTNDGLVTYRRVEGLAGSTLVPDLATSLPAPTDNGRTYTFQLRSGIRYSNGAPLRPEDFGHELERVLMSGNGYETSFYTGIVGAPACLRTPKHCTLANGVVANDRTDTVTFHLTAPDPDFLYKLAFPWADAVPANTPYREHGNTLPPATGPYMTKSIMETRVIGPLDSPLAFGTWTLVRNPRFHVWAPAAQPAGYPDEIVMTQGISPDRALDEVERNDLDVLVQPPANRLGELATHYTSQVHSEPVGATFSLVMNTRTPPFDRLAVRQALNYAINRGRIVALAGGPLAARPTCQVLPPTMQGYQPYCPYTIDPTVDGSWRAPNIAEAQRLVASSGTRGMKVTLVAQRPNSTNPTSTIGHYVVSVLDRLGYRATLKLIQNAYAILGDSRSDSQIGWWPWFQDYPAPFDFISDILTCQSYVPNSPANINDSGFCDRQVDAEVQRASSLQALAPGASSLTWQMIDRQITNKAPWLPLYNPRLDVITSARVGNFQYHPFFSLLVDQLWVR
jgi:peptide/nickel transport system substrate-binding protein